MRCTKFKDLEKNLVKHSSGCWGWRGSVESNGMPKVETETGGHSRSVYYLLFELAAGDTPTNKQQYSLDRTCGQKFCCNPSHYTRRLDKTRRVSVLAPPSAPPGLEIRIALLEARLDVLEAENVALRKAASRVRDLDLDEE